MSGLQSMNPEPETQNPEPLLPTSYRTREGEVWELANVAPLELPGFYRATRVSDRAMVIVHRHRCDFSPSVSSVPPVVNPS